MKILENNEKVLSVSLNFSREGIGFEMEYYPTVNYLIQNEKGIEYRKKEFHYLRKAEADAFFNMLKNQINE